MGKRCDLTGKRMLVGNNVSHANNKTKRRFEPNLQTTRLLSESLGESIRVKVSASGLRTIERRGGLDAYLLSTRNEDLSADMVRLKRRLKKAQAAATAG